MKSRTLLLLAAALAYAEARFAPGSTTDEVTTPENDFHDGGEITIPEFKGDDGDHKVITIPEHDSKDDEEKVVTTPETDPNAIDPNEGDTKDDEKKVVTTPENDPNAIDPNKDDTEKPPFYLLVGDSTVASNTGWGDGFLELTSHPDNGINWGKGGATTVSFREEGLWDQVIDNTTAFKVDHEPIVTIQFGHNDHKVDSGISLHGFEENLKNMALDVKKAGGTPIIFTPLAVRAFENDTVVDSLAQQREKAIAAARAAGVKFIDLNTASREYVQKIGKESSSSYDLNSNDQVHLNPTGRAVFARLVADLVVKARPDLEKSLKPKDDISEKIAAGEVATTGEQPQEQKQEADDQQPQQEQEQKLDEEKQQDEQQQEEK